MNQGKKTALVTGASGFLGSHLARHLSGRGYEVHALVRKTSDLSRLVDIPLKFHFAGLEDAEGLSAAVKGMDYVFHCAGTILAKNLDGYLKGNRDGTKTLMDAVAKVNGALKRFVYVSSQSAGSSSEGRSPVDENTQPRPTTYYGMSKLAAEKVVLGYRESLAVSIVRPPAIYGPSDRPTMNFFRFAKLGLIPLLGREKRFLSIAHVHDVSEAIMLAAEREESRGETYYVSDGCIYSWLEIWEMLCKATGKKGTVIRIPPGLFFLCANVSEFIGRLVGKPMMLNYHKATDLTKSWALDISKIKSSLGFEPKYGFEEGARETYMWYRQAGWL